MYQENKDYISYFVRIFPSYINSSSTQGIQTEEYEVNPDILSISTTRDLNSPCASWTIEFNYREGDFGTDSWFGKIQPMDYVEIYMRRGSLLVANSASQNIGIQDYTDQGIGVFERKDKTLTPMQHTNNNLLWKYGFDSIKGQPLGAEEKAVNPDLIMCGYVDTIENRFNISATGTNNRIVISGKCVGKWLVTHEVYLNYLDTQIVKLIGNSMLVLGQLKCADVIDYILTMYLQNWIGNNARYFPVNYATFQKLKESNIDQFSIQDSSNYRNKSQINVNPTNQDKTDSTDAIKTQAFVNKRDYESITKFIYWAIARPIPLSTWYRPTEWDDNDVWWARIEDNSPRILNSSAQVDQGKLWEMLCKNVDLNQNEMWLDEAGILVLRKKINAWTQPDLEVELVRGEKQRYSSIRGWYYNDRPWIKIDSSEILTWNIKKSDTELKTLVTLHSMDNINYQQNTISATIGQAPLTEEARKTAKKVWEESGLTGAQLDRLNKQYLQNIAGYDLSNFSQIQKFWLKYGVRVGSFGNQYSSDDFCFAESALAMLEMYGSLFFTGTLTVKGDAKYKVGRMLLIKDLNLEFYITGVSHRMIWGESWSTTLKLTRGCVVGELFDPLMRPTIESTAQDTIPDVNTNMVA